MPSLPHAERLRQIETFRRGCRAALEACAAPGVQTDEEHNALALKLCRPDLVREPKLQDLFPPEGPSCA